MRHFVKTGVFLSLVLFFTACGYRPSAEFSRASLGKSVSTSVVISETDPENTVLIKDALDRAIIETFRTSLASKQNAQTHLDIKMANPSYVPIQYNSNGYVIAYRMGLSLHLVQRDNKDGIKKRYQARGTYDFTVEPNAVVTDLQRFNAIRESAKKALASFAAQVSAQEARERY